MSSISNFLFGLEQSSQHLINSAFDPNNHRVFSGYWSDSQLGMNRLGAIIHGVIGSNVKTFGKSIGNASSSVLSSLSFQPSFYILGGDAILVLVLLLKIGL